MNLSNRLIFRRVFLRLRGAIGSLSINAGTKISATTIEIIRLTIITAEEIDQVHPLLLGKKKYDGERTDRSHTAARMAINAFRSR